MLVELDPDGPLERCQRLAQLRLNLGDLKLNLEHLTPGRNQGHVIHVACLVVARRRLQRLHALGQDARTEQLNDVALSLRLRPQTATVSLMY